MRRNKQSTKWSLKFLIEIERNFFHELFSIKCLSKKLKKKLSGKRIYLEHVVRRIRLKMLHNKKFFSLIPSMNAFHRHHKLISFQEKDFESFLILNQIHRRHIEGFLIACDRFDTRKFLQVIFNAKRKKKDPLDPSGKSSSSSSLFQKNLLG